MNLKKTRERRGVTLDVIDDTEPADTPGGSIIVPSRVVLNGQSILMPEGSAVVMRARDGDAAEVTLTMMVNRLRVGHADDLDEPAPGGLLNDLETKEA